MRFQFITLEIAFRLPIKTRRHTPATGSSQKGSQNGPAALANFPVTLRQNRYCGVKPELGQAIADAPKETASGVFGSIKMEYPEDMLDDAEMID